VNRIIKIICLAVSFVQLSACDLIEGDASVSGAVENQGNLTVPAALKGSMATATFVPKDVTAWVIVDGDSDNAQKMDFVNDRQQVSLTIPNLSTGEHTFSIVYKYLIESPVIEEVVIFHTLDTTMRLVAGDNTMSSSNMAVLNEYKETDANQDGNTNLADIQVNLDPERCVLGAPLADKGSILGQCRLTAAMTGPTAPI